MEIGPNTWRVGPSSPSRTSVRRRSSTGSSSSASASSSMCCSTAQQTCGAVGARIEPEGWLFVYASVDSTFTFSTTYGPHGVHRRHLGEEAALPAVGAAVQDEAAAARDERAVAAGAGLELDHHPFAAVVGRDELLLAREDELHGPAGGPRERGDVALEVEVALGAEAAAEQRDDDPHVRLGKLQDAGDAGPRGVGNLGRAPDGDPVAVPLGEDRPRLDRRALRGLGHVPALDDDVCALHRGVGVALHDGREAEDVPFSPSSSSTS